MNILNVFEGSLTFILISVGIIAVVIVTYFLFFKPKTKYVKPSEDIMESDIDENTIDGEHLSNTNLTESADIQKKSENMNKNKEPLEDNLQDKIEQENESNEQSLKTRKTINSDAIAEKNDNDKLVLSSKEKKESVKKKESVEEKESVKEKESKEDTKSKENTESEEEQETVELGKYHILYRDKDNKWIVKREGSDKTIRVLYTKKEAIAYATIKAINQDTNIVIHGKDGKIEKHGY